MMYFKIDQVWKLIGADEKYKITGFEDQYDFTRVIATRIIGELEYPNRYFARTNSQHIVRDSFILDWELIDSKRNIPGIPLDPTLPILEAGHLQDRQRKRFKP